MGNYLLNNLTQRKKSPSSADNTNTITNVTPTVNKKLKVGISTPTKLEELDVDSMSEEQLSKEVLRLSQMLTKKKEQYQHLQHQLSSNNNPQVSQG